MPPHLAFGHLLPQSSLGEKALSASVLPPELPKAQVSAAIESVEAVADRVLAVVVLVILLRLEEGGGGADLSDDFPFLPLSQGVSGCDRGTVLRLVMEEDCRS